jgi:hypothetical protein
MRPELISYLAGYAAARRAERAAVIKALRARRDAARRLGTAGALQNDLAHDRAEQARALAQWLIEELHCEGED